MTIAGDMSNEHINHYTFERTHDISSYVIALQVQNWDVGIVW